MSPFQPLLAFIGGNARTEEKRTTPSLHLGLTLFACGLAAPVAIAIIACRRR